MLLESETFPGTPCFISFPVISTKIAASRSFFDNISSNKLL
ncbi:hypothetical protein T06_14879 [Trichinella sp. T6]|nr:hypothetical protein T06_14879 [Trichinella sp. T6]